MSRITNLPPEELEKLLSQGTVAGTRKNLLLGELKRLEEYRTPKFGSMFTADEIEDYLDWRDSITSLEEQAEVAG